MIYFLTKAVARRTLGRLLAFWGRDAASFVSILPYEGVFSWRNLPGGTYVFTDLERMTPDELDRAAHLWNEIDRSGLGVPLLNHPLRAMRRYQLLRTLCDAGLNDFDVLRAVDSRRPARFPVFVRREDDHRGADTDLIQTPEELQTALDDLVNDGANLDSRLIVEFRADADDQGFYRRYSAYIIGDEIIPACVMFGDHWIVKGNSTESERTLSIERTYVDGNPDEKWIRRVCEMANIEYGRIDYGFANGRPQVFEINTNPGYEGPEPPDAPRAGHKERVSNRVVEALRKIDQAGGVGKIPIRHYQPRPEDNVHTPGVRLFQLLYRAGLGRFEQRLQLLQEQLPVLYKRLPRDSALKRFIRGQARKRHLEFLYRKFL